MSSYPQGRQVVEFASRTVKNLEIIEKVAEVESELSDDEKTAFEVTQALNLINKRICLFSSIGVSDSTIGK